VRLFLAVETSPALRAVVWERVAAARRTVSVPASTRWIREGGWHLTLEFLGEVADDAVAALAAACAVACAACRSFTARLTAGGWFPSGGPARTVWVGADGGAALALLQARVAAAARGGAIDGARPFHAHLTLARCDPPWPRRTVEEFVARLGKLTDLEVVVNEVALLRSHLGRGGSRYEAVARFPLAGRTGAAR
jgi:2'-5' RNA ligase